MNKRPLLLLLLCVCVHANANCHAMPNYVNALTHSLIYLVPLDGMASPLLPYGPVMVFVFLCLLLSVVCCFGAYRIPKISNDQNLESAKNDQNILSIKHQNFGEMSIKGL